MNFLESPRFPGTMAQHALRHLSFLTEVVGLASGSEQRNALWSQPLRRYEVGANFQTQAELNQLLAFFQLARGRFLPFRFRDSLDFNSNSLGHGVTATDQMAGWGDGLQRAFQLIKTTRLGEIEQIRVIQKPVPGTVIVAVDGALEKQVTVECSTGVITFAEPPPLGAAITAGFEFDVPCRFDSDQLSVSLQPPDLGSFTLLLTEVRLAPIDLSAVHSVQRADVTLDLPLAPEPSEGN